MQTLSEIEEILKSYDGGKHVCRWKKYGDVVWDSYGLTFAELKKIAKKIPADRALALQLRRRKNYDMKVLSFLIDDPQKIPVEETRRTITNANLWPLHKMYLQAIFIKLPYAMELASLCRSSSISLERRYGYCYLSYIAKNKKIPDEYFIPIVNIIEAKLQLEDNYVKDAMNTVLYAIGSRSEKLRVYVLNAAKNIGVVKVDYGASNARPIDVVMLLEKKEK